MVATWISTGATRIGMGATWIGIRATWISTGATRIGMGATWISMGATGICIDATWIWTGATESAWLQRVSETMQRRFKRPLLLGRLHDWDMAHSHLGRVPMGAMTPTRTPPFVPLVASAICAVFLIGVLVGIKTDWPELPFVFGTRPESSDPIAPTRITPEPAVIAAANATPSAPPRATAEAPGTAVTLPVDPPLTPAEGLRLAALAAVDGDVRAVLTIQAQLERSGAPKEGLKEIQRLLQEAQIVRLKRDRELMRGQPR